MASSNYHWSNDQNKPRRTDGKYEVKGINMLNAKVDNLVNLFNKKNNVNFVSSSIMICNIRGGGHLSTEYANLKLA